MSKKFTIKMYLQSVNQISAQKPLSDEWFDNPLYHTEKRVPTINPDFAGHFPPLVARRLCVLLKRAVMLSRLTLQDASVVMPDAIISGTGLGCIDNTEKFIYLIRDNNEKFLQPTYFMQSTHNILSSTIAIDLKCHGYNNTFVHRGASFENALLDAIMQIEQGMAQTVLVGGYDELTNDYYSFFDRIGIWDFVPGSSPKQHCFASEAAVSMLLSKTIDSKTICKITDVTLMHRQTSDQMKQSMDTLLSKAGCNLSEVDAVLTGINTHADNDLIYREAINHFFGDIPVMQYKHLFGESFSSSALAVYVAATCLRKGYIPAMLLSDENTDLKDVKRILVYNHYRNKTHSLILLSSCSS